MNSEAFKLELANYQDPGKMSFRALIETGLEYKTLLDLGNQALMEDPNNGEMLSYMDFIKPRLQKISEELEVRSEYIFN